MSFFPSLKQACKTDEDTEATKYHKDKRGIKIALFPCEWWSMFCLAFAECICPFYAFCLCFGIDLMGTLKRIAAKLVPSEPTLSHWETIEAKNNLRKKKKHSRKRLKSWSQKKKKEEEEEWAWNKSRLFHTLRAPDVMKWKELLSKCMNKALKYERIKQHMG